MPLSRLNHTASALAVYASQDGSPHHHARLASGCRPGSTGRAFHPQGSDERFQTHVMLVIPLSQACLAQASSLFIDAPKPLAFLELRPQWQQRRGTGTPGVCLHARKSRMNQKKEIEIPGAVSSVSRTNAASLNPRKQVNRQFSSLALEQVWGSLLLRVNPCDELACVY